MEAKNSLVFTPNDIKRIAMIYRIPITSSELNLFTLQLSKTSQILNIFQKLRLKIRKLTPTYHAAGLKNSFRNDEIKPCILKEETLSNAPNKYKNFFRIPRIFKHKQ